MLSPQWLDELRARVTLSSVVMRTTKLQRAGREWKACCPFHDEKTPSFYVNDAKGFYHCFGCQQHGDVIRWMTDQRGLGFMDAVKELAAEAGMELPAPDPKAAKRAEKRDGLADVTAAAQDWFVSNLRGADGAEARAYLERRGIDRTTAERFGFGYAPADRQALAPALSRFDEALLIEAGMRTAVEGKEPYDRFRGRLMLPIHDARGRVIAFGGRILDAEANPKAPKYLNSPDTPLFDKGRNLYNLHRAASASRKADRMIVVEGYMDVIALAAAGIEEAVAPMGTALTESQIELLWRHVDTPLLCFDGDGAGRRAAVKAAMRALPQLRPGHTLAFVHLPAGLDPDDLLRERGRSALDRLLAEPVGLLDTLWQHERDAAALDTPEAKAGLKQRLLALVDTIEDADIRSLYRRELTDRFSAFAYPPREQGRWSGGKSGFSGRSPFARPLSQRLGSDTARRLNHAAAGGGRDRLVRAVVSGLRRFPDQLPRHADTLSQLAARDSNIAPAIDSLLDSAESLEPSADSPISGDTGPAAATDKAHFAFLREGTDPSEAREDLAEAVTLLVERPALDAALLAATARFETDPEGALAEQARLRDRKREFDERLARMGRERAAREPARETD